ncbi:MAG: class I SAM-dependent methyltransferase [Hyphomicrobiales bacterium]|nr:class I SAM-dependent methyltransferase [Hyphomicrobiales bacterium]
MADEPSDADFSARRRHAASRARAGSDGDLSWFDAVYGRAEGDEAQVPWADLAPKEGLPEWLDRHHGEGRTALDIGCGLGDNAEALAAAGYDTTAFDLSERAIGWARQRFPDSSVAYVEANLFSPPQAWSNTFDLVFECFTIQALAGELRRAAYGAIADFIAPGGQLLMITLTRDESTDFDGPPWPLMPSEIDRFDQLWLAREEEKAYTVDRLNGRSVRHLRVCYRKP